MAKKKPSIERRLYEAFHAGRGIRLTADEVEDLLTLDNAIHTRICNAAATDAGLGEPGEGGDFFSGGLSWGQLGKHCGIKGATQ
jgi:hypothetical protein